MAMEAPQAAALPVSIVGLDHAVGGYLHGLSQPFLRARLRFDLPAEVDWGPIDEALGGAAPLADDQRPTLNAEPLAGAIERIILWTAELQRIAQSPVLEAGRLLWRREGEAQVVVLALPTIDHAVAASALELTVSLINRGLQGGMTGAELAAAAEAETQALAGKTQGLKASNTIRFLEAAHKRGMPWFRLTGGTFQIGYGARARWLDSSSTDATSAIGMGFARNKAAAASLLRQAGLPVPTHQVVTNADAAVRAAKALGFPVVVKPLDADGGLGVSVKLKTPEAVRKAFGDARKFSASVLVETFVEGRDYRLMVMHGRLILAIERAPGGVVGDGKSSVLELIDQVNADPRRGDARRGVLKKLLFDEEATTLLAEQGLTGASVPGDGERVRLRGAANVASGGMPISVFDQVHPDNAMLAVRAARVLRLDLAGVDLLIPDIARSWKETGASICEVNAQPTIGAITSAHLYGQILEELVMGDGRIPIALLVDPAKESRAGSLIATILSGAGGRVGLATAGGVWIAGEHIGPGPSDAWAGGRVLIGDNTVDAAVVVVNDSRPIETGLPFDRCAVVALAGSRLGDGAGPGFSQLAGALLPMSLGHVVINAEDPACLALGKQIRGGTVVLYAASAGQAEVVDHCGRGGTGVWLDETAGGARLVIAHGSAPQIALSLGRPSGSADEVPFGAEEVVLAVAVALALGCSEGLLRERLAAVRLGVSASPAP